jgi:hypothetical protein
VLYKVDFKNNPGMGLLKQQGMSYSDAVTYHPGESSLLLPGTSYAGYLRVRSGFAFKYALSSSASSISHSMIVKIASENFYNPSWQRYGHKYHLGAAWYISGSGSLFLRLHTLLSWYDSQEKQIYEEPYRDEDFPYTVRSNYTRTVTSSEVLVPDTWYWLELTASLVMATKDMVNPFFKTPEIWGYPLVSATTKINGKLTMPAPDLRSLVQPMEYAYYINEDKTVGETITQLGGVKFGTSYFADVFLDTGWN